MATSANIKLASLTPARALRNSLLALAASVVCAGVPAAVASQTASVWTDADGNNNWFDPNNWSPSGVPNNAISATFAVSVQITNPVQLGSSATIDSLDVGTGGQVQIEGGYSLNIATTTGISDNGTITVNAGGTYAGATILSFTGTGNNLLTGNGQIVLDAPTGNSFAAQLNTGTGATLTQDVNHSIVGTGEINAALTNNGTVNANVSGGTLYLQTNNMTNNNLFEATSGSSLNVSGITISQGSSSQILAAANSTVNLNGTTVSGGSILVDSTGTLNFTGGATISSGLLTVDSGATATSGNGTNSLADLTNGGSFSIADGSIADVAGATTTDNGTITVNAGGTYAGATILSFTGTGNNLLTGNGQIVLDAPTDNSFAAAAQLNTGTGATLTQDVNHSIVGTGEINAALTNNGTVNANVSGGTLYVNGATVNSGTMEGTNGGTLTLENSTLTNSNLLEATGGALTLNNDTLTNNGHIEAINGSTLSISGTTISQGSGGSILVDSTGTLNFTGGATISSGLLTVDSGATATSGNGTNSVADLTNGGSFSIADGSIADVAGATTTDNGTITVNAGGTYAGATILSFTGTGNNLLTGNGQIVLDAPTDNSFAAQLNTGTGATLTQDVNHSIVGTGEINAALTNNGTVNANVSGGTLYVNGATVNNGTFEATDGGTLDIYNITNYSAGALTGGIYKAVDSGAGAAIVLNGNIATNAADITLSGTNSVFSQINPLAVNRGEFRLLADRNFTAQAGFDNQAGALLQLGGGTFAITSGNFTNEGTVQGFGTITPQITNTGTIEATGGTLALSNGALDPGANSTLQSDVGATLDLSGGATSSTTDYLTNNGKLTLGNNNVTVNQDYQNANFGTGNSFNPLANVSSTGGQILAGGNADIGISGSVTLASTTARLLTYTLAFGDIHSNSTATLNYQIEDTGDTGPIIRGAMQTDVNGGNITDSRLSGGGVIAGGGSLAPGQTTSQSSVVFTPDGQDGPLSGQVVHIEGNFANIHQANIDITGTAYNYAVGTVTSPTTINIGDVHVGDAVLQNITVQNSAAADGFSENLDGQLGAGTGNAVTNGGTFTGLAAGATLAPANTLTIGLNTSTAGSLSGSASLALQSDGTGIDTLGKTSLAAQTVSINATAYNYAVGTITSPTTINIGDVHVGDAVLQNITVQNSAAADGFSENLDGQLGAGTGNAVTNGGTFTGLAAGATLAPANTLTIGLNTGTAGNLSGSASLALQSDGTGIDTLGKTSLAAQTVSINATAYNYAVGTITSPTTINIGDVHVGDAVLQNITVQNSAAADGFSENLDGQLGAGTGNAVTNGGTFTGLAAGATLAPANTLTIGLNTGTAGNLSGSASLALQSDGTGIDTLGKTSLAAQTVSINATAYNYAVGTITSPTTINIGDVHVGDAVLQNITVQNSAAADGFSENLDGQLGAGTGNAVTNGGTFTGLAAGATLAPANTLTIGLNTGTAGNLSGSASLALQSDGTGIDTLGKTSLAAQTVSINATAYNYAVGTITSPTTINIGDVHVGDAVLQNITVQNSAAADGFSENLDGQLGAGTGNAVTNGGTFTGLAAGATLAPANTLTIGLNTGTAGNLSGSASLALQSDGTGIDTLGKTSLAAQTVSINATAYNYAGGAITSPTTINIGDFHTGDTVTENITVQNSAPSDGFSENLDGQLSAGTGNAATNGGAFTGLAAGATLAPANALTISLSGSSGGGTLSGSATLALQSDGTGIDMLGKTSLSSQTITINASAYNLAAATISSPTTINVGNVHVGDAVTQDITVQNSAVANGFSENLDGQLGAGTGNAVTNGGTFTGLAAGATLAPANTLTIGLNTGTAGNVSGSASLALQSDGTGIDTLGKTSLASQTVSINATAYNYAVANISSTTINLGIVHTGDTANQALTISNAAPAGTFSEGLDAQFGTITGAATTNGGSVSLIAAGSSNSSSMVVGINTSTAGTESGTVLVNLQSDGQGTSGLGKIVLSNSPATINVSAQVNNYASALLLLGSHSAGSSLTENSATLYTLNLGTAFQGGSNLAAALGIENSAIGPADTLAGNFNTSNAAPFTLSGFGNFINVAAGSSNANPSISLSDANTGNFSGSITLDPFSQNASGYNGALSPITIDVNGSVAIANDLIWDSSGTNPTAPVDGVGTWNTTSTNWSNRASNMAWNNATESGVMATFGANNGTAGTVTLGANIQVGGLTFNAATSGNYTIAGSGSYSLELAGSTVIANANATLAANTTFDQGLNLSGGGTLTLAGRDTSNGATVIQAGSLALAPGGTLTGTTALTIASGATLNLGNTNAGNQVVINYGANPSPNSAIQSYIASGAITTAAGYAVGYADGANGVVSGLSAGQEKIMATLPGDANLAGTVSFTDFNILRSNFGTSSGAQWDQGDFNGDGAVNFTDFNLLRANFGKSLTAPTGSIVAGTAKVLNTMATLSNSGTLLPKSDVELLVNTTTGDVMLSTAVSGGLPIDGYQIDSAGGNIVSANLHSISSVDSGFFLLDNKSTQVSEGSFSTYTLNPSFNLGDIFNVAGRQDLVFTWGDANSNTYSDAPVIYTSVPEPAALALLAVGGMGLLLLGRKRRKE